MEGAIDAACTNQNREQNMSNIIIEAKEVVEEADQEEQLKEENVTLVASSGTSQKSAGITRRMKNVKIW